MAITIPPHEMTKMEELMGPAWAAAALQNDIFSWSKERDAAKKYGKKEVVNAVWVLMGEYSIEEEEAMEKLRGITKAYVKDYVEIAEREIKNESLSIDLRRYLDAILYSLSGNAVWSIVCPRYHSGQEYNESQLALMDWGVKENSEGSSDGKEEISLGAPKSLKRPRDVSIEDQESDEGTLHKIQRIFAPTASLELKGDLNANAVATPEQQSPVEFSGSHDILAPVSHRIST